MSFISGMYRFDFMGHMKWWFALSGIIIGAGLVSLAVQGLNYGLEFKEGTRIAVAFEKSPTLAEVRNTVADLGYGDAQIQEVSAVGGTSLPGFQIQVETLTPAEQAKLKQALDDKYTIATQSGAQEYASETVGPTFGGEVVTSSYQAAGLALLLILIYVSFRFQWKFAVGAIAAEFHDLLVVVGVYSLTGREVTTATVAAVLTILGYSLYDTVIVYDRIRENTAKLGRQPYPDIVNRSIWETLTRSINTTLTVLLPVLMLLLFGGTTLTDFAFALLVGILSGAYSSIFVASPVVTLLKQREPQYKRLAARAEQA
jgi:SecD/SecF fusion protein